MPFLQQISKLEDHEVDDVGFCVKLDEFLKTFSINSYKLSKIEGDASKRHYYRVHTRNRSYIVMDASAEPSSITPFVDMANFLIAHQIAAPAVYGKNMESGLLLLEDFGDLSFTKFLSENPQMELELYSKAVQILLKLQTIQVEIQIPKHDDKLLNAGLLSFTEFYVQQKLESRKAVAISKEILNAFSEYYSYIRGMDRILVLRDYHADNLMWISGREGIDSVGVLDFQDAVMGFPCYDLASLLEDARRDVKPGTIEKCKAIYFDHMQQNSRPMDYEAIYNILSAQRNIRIIGLFHRLISQYRREKYLQYLPRVWKNLRKDLQHPKLAQLKNIFDKYKLYEF